MNPVAEGERARTERAARRVDSMIGFYVHLAIFVVVVGLLAVLNASLGGGWWVQWLLFGWGVGVVAHAVGVFGRTPAFVERWRRRKIAEYRDKL